MAKRVCVKVDVSDGQSRAVKPKEKVSISATAKPRFGGGAITGRMESKKTAGQKKVEPAKVSSSPAKFTYTAPDKSPEAGSVQLKSVSKRGIGITDLAYTTEGDLEIDAAVGQGHATAVKCGGPAGSWDLAYTVATQGNVAGHIAVTLAKDTLSGTWQAGGFAQSGGRAPRPVRAELRRIARHPTASRGHSRSRPAATCPSPSARSARTA